MSLRTRVLLVAAVSTALMAGMGLLLLESYSESKAAVAHLITLLTPGATISASQLSTEASQALFAARESGSRLRTAMTITMVLGLMLPLISHLVLRQQVLGPIARLRIQLRRAAAPGAHDAVIIPIGPSEICELGSDAEALRRALVAEIDESRAAQAALAQEGPVVAAIRRELSARTDQGPDGVQIQGILRPAQGVLAGDFWERLTMPDGRAAAIVCDVAGHGPRAGIIGMRMKTSITQGLLSGQKPTEILHRACETFGDEPESFATAVLVIVDTRDDSIEWVNAGHPAPILLNTAGQVRRLEQTGPLVSWLIGSWSTRKVSFQPGDLCLAFTDGLSESRTPEGNELGASALEAMVRRAATANDPAEVTARLLAEIRERSGDLGRDDVTVVGIRRGLLVRG